MYEIFFVNFRVIILCGDAMTGALYNNIRKT